MKLHLSQSHTLSPPFSLLQFPTRNFLLPSHTPNFNSLRSLHRSALLRRRQKPNSKFFRVSAKECELLEGEEAELMVATCITRTLPPALTLEHGLNQIEEAVGELKSNPPRSTNGMYRFQVAVPPSAKALNWFCSQPESSKVFPLFFISKEKHNSTFRSLSLREVRGVFGIGAAILFEGSSSCASAEWSSLKRYLPLDSSLVMAYGFMDLDFNMRSSSVKHSRGSFYLFIPEIELSEFEGISMLAATLVWDDSSLCTFEEAIQSYESALHQVSHHFWPTTEKFHNKCIRSAVRKFNMTGDTNTQMPGPSSFCQFSVRLSPTLEIVNNMYFCVAPGSRSSPLAIAASAHPRTTCIACFDERSLAFHAVGFGRGSHIPAVVITSSGTAVSNLLPAVVEASQDFIPLLLLTADRPPELQDAGANQAINQVNHFGSFVRFFYGLPAPTDNIPARMVLTTIDSAVYWATSSPYGPVHINCPFREPLDNSTRQWMSSCLKGLNFWMSSAQPFTNYIQVQYDFACNGTQSQMAEVLQVIQGANRGLLLIGAMHREDDIWAALLLAKHLSWPVVADILSGLRLRKYLNYFEFEKNFLFIDHLDHSLLSDSVRSWAQADVIVQVHFFFLIFIKLLVLCSKETLIGTRDNLIVTMFHEHGTEFKDYIAFLIGLPGHKDIIGSRITSKRISQMLEDCVQCSYIIVENHPSRHDPSHIVKHRIQSTVTQFADCLLKDHIPQISSEWCGILQAVDKMVTWEMAFQIHSESSLTEPYVAHLIPKALHCESAIFVGNSMPIRDADMYGHNWAECTSDTAAFLSLDLPCHWIRVAGNRGASGIDGLLSTAIGFAVGCNKQVICVIGDVSFLHDTNGLALLKQRSVFII
ncbi:2-oxoglutarate decarboxylase/hydro-lyase/magnesium ion-binding protein [Actinidia rufa]|uniref:2-oxoglutarate decarboxylase/hydro-lyase/magnesium ion-binding protein n=1 Tax=Actinidia rufa TaxID=165716 RepID=A0A7J0GZH9_9ERIC|nr:2-oxoglutarate decarboxylase/hydro-lyase/magnesium ion-binding protein [Actinidia rufa]